MPPPSHRPSSLSGHARSASASSASGGVVPAQRTAAAVPSSQPGSRKTSDRLGELKGTHKRSASSTSSDKAGHRKSRSELELARRKVKLLSAFPRALSPTLPPSPPASRSPSPDRAALRAPTTTTTAAAAADRTPSSASTSTTVSPAAVSTGAAASKTSIPSPPSEAESSSTKAGRNKRKRRRSRSDDDSDDDRRAVVRRREARKAKAGQDWTVDKFKALAHSFRERARKLKHTADARSRAASTSGQAQSSLVFLTELTDSILLWVYAFWADDQTTPGRVNVDMWRSLDGMKKVVRAGWETVVKAAEADAATKDRRRRLRRVRAVLGLVYLVDALVLLHTTTYAQSSLHNRTQRLQASLGAAAAARPLAPTTTTNGAAATKPAAAVGANGSSGSSVPAESPASLASSVSSPASSSDPAAAGSSAANALPPDYLPTVMGLTASLTRALRLHGTSQALLSERDIERDFPKTWRRCHPRRRRSSSVSSASDSSSDSSDDDGGGPTALLTFSPSSPQLVDPDEPALGWAWPIGLSSVPALAGIPGVPALAGGSAGQAQGMGGMLPHLVVFGRSLLGEWAAVRAVADPDLKGWSYNLASGWLTPAAASAA